MSDGQRPPVQRLTDVVPRWLFSVRRPLLRVAVGVVAAAAVVVPLALADDPSEFRPGSVFALAVLVAGAIGGVWTAAIAGTLSFLGYWYIGVPPTNSFELDGSGSGFAVVVFALVVVAICLLTYRLEQALAGVTALDELQTRAVAAERDARQAAEEARSQSDRIARTLTTTLLPPRLPPLFGFEAAAWIRAASSDQVAGDFYDLFVVRSGWIAVMGDVQGKGAEAAAVTSLARYVARVAALDHPSPAHVLTVVNDALLADASERFVTMAVVHGVVEPDPMLDVGIAGHPQPRLITNTGVKRLGEHGRPLGLWDIEPKVHSFPIDNGDTLLLYTDGLLDHRDLTFDEDQFDAELAELVDHDASSVCEALESVVRSRPPAHVDDIAVLAITRTD